MNDLPERIESGGSANPSAAQLMFLEACRKEDVQLVWQSLRDGLDPNAPIPMGKKSSPRADGGEDHSWFTMPIIRAANTMCVDILKAVVRAGGSPSMAINADGVTPLMNCVAGLASVQICEVLIEAGDDVNATSLDGFSVFHKAIVGGGDRYLQLLEDHGVQKMDARLPDGRSAFHLAYDTKGGLRWLAQRMPHLIDARGPSGQTALHMAVENDEYHCARFLVELGADLSVRDDNHRMAEDIARSKGRLELAGELQAMRQAKEAASVIELVRRSASPMHGASGAAFVGSTGRG